MPLSWKRPEPWATQVGLPDLRIKKTDLGQARDRRAIPTVDFLLADFRRDGKKHAVKIHV
jgi:hypothetical protein